MSLGGVNSRMGLKKNFLYSGTLTCANYIFPMLTYPYVARVLGVENIGIYNFADAIISYFLLFSFMGVNSVGIREVAKAKGNQERLDKVYRSLLILVLISTSIATSILLAATFNVPKLYVHKELMFIGAVRLFCSVFQVEWLFKGLEEFKYITTRSLIVKCFYVASVFVFVRKADDYVIYFALYTLMVFFNALINLIHSRKFVTFRLKGIKIKSYIKPFFSLGVYMLLTSMYTSFNVAYLGFVAGEKQVGYYTTATKLYSIFLSIYSAFTGVMLPRMSSLLEENENEKFKKAIGLSQHILFAFAIPVLFFAVALAPDIIRVMAGPGYEDAILPMRIVLPLLVICGYEQIEVIQILMPMKQDGAILRNSFFGATTGILLNIIIVPHMQSVGSAIVWLCSEIVVLICAQVVIAKKIHLFFPLKKISYQLITYSPLLAFFFFIKETLCNSIVVLLTGGGMTILYFVLVKFWLFKDEELLLVLPEKIRYKISK